MFAGGGTGGHLYPGLAIARAMVSADPSVEPFFVGARRGIERDVLPTTEFEHVLLDLHPLYRRKVWENWRTIRGAGSAWRTLSQIVGDLKPRAIVGTGGYASGIALGYGAVHGIPLVLQEQNSFPGITARFFSRYARQVHLGFPEAAGKLKPGSRAEIFDSGNPIDPPPASRPARHGARAVWNFPDDESRVLLVYGGSQGAKAINDTVAAWIARGLPRGLRIIWGTGKGQFELFSGMESDFVRVRAYIAPMADAYAASDIALSRGGAMATAELCAWGIPPIVVPLPTAAADHQTANARALANAGAAEWIPQSELTVDLLDSTVRSLLDDPELLASRARGAESRARPNAAAEIAARILAMAGDGSIRNG